VDVPFSWHSLDLFDNSAVAGAIRSIRPDTILHLAWVVEHGAFWTSPHNLDWVAASLALARAGAEADIRRFVGVGTCFEYDFPAHGDCDESYTPLETSTLYAGAKDSTRRLIELFSRDAGFSFAWARLFFLYGPGEGPERLVASVARALVAGETARCASGRPIRDFMDVRDAGEALAAVALSPVAGAVNVGTGEGHSIADVANRLAVIAGRPGSVQMSACSDRPNEPPRIVANVARLRKEAGFRNARSMDEGLRDALRYWAELKSVV
jgi:nucleoside-diphosphate-sugar epimerase